MVQPSSSSVGAAILPGAYFRFHLPGLIHYRRGGGLTIKEDFGGLAPNEYLLARPAWLTFGLAESVADVLCVLLATLEVDLVQHQRRRFVHQCLLVQLQLLSLVSNGKAENF